MKEEPMKKQAILILSLAIVMFLTANFPRAEQKPGAVTKAQWEQEFQLIKELFRLTDRYGDKIWPGFDMRKIPIGINYEYRQEVLINHPKPPAEFREFKDADLCGLPVMIRDGCTMYASVGGAIRINGMRTSYAQVPGKEISTEKHLLTLLHEGFHVFQYMNWGKPEGLLTPSPIYDIQNSAGVALENTILYTALQEKSQKNLTELAKMLVAVRSQRQENFPEAVRREEDHGIFAEGTALYSEARLMQLLYLEGNQTKDGATLFADTGKSYRNYLDGILPPKDKIITLGHERYQNGMAQAFLLDRLRPGWKKEMAPKGTTQFTLLKQQFPLEEKEKARLISAAKKKFAFEKILAMQESLINERLALIRDIVETPGRRYRIYFYEVPLRLKWKFRFPVYELPGQNVTEAQQKLLVSPGETFNAEQTEALVMPKGLERLEAETGFLFQGRETPLVQWIGMINFLEWIDDTPAADKSDMKIQADKQEEDVYTNLLLETDGFTLRISRARIAWSDKIVEIHPLPKETADNR